MIRAVRSMAAALASEFGTPQRAADEIQLHVRRADLTEMRGIYYPPDEKRARPALLLAHDVSAEERSVLLLHAVGHLYLRHRTLGYYEYSARGPAYDAARDQKEVALFAKSFLERTSQLAIAPRTLKALARR